MYIQILQSASSLVPRDVAVAFQFLVYLLITFFLVILVDLLISNFFLPTSHTSVLALLTSIFAKHHINSPKIIPSAFLPLTIQGHNPNTFPVVTDRAIKGFYFRWLTNFNSQKINLYFFGKERPKIGPKFAKFFTEINHKFYVHYIKQNFKISSPPTALNLSRRKGRG